MMRMEKRQEQCNASYDNTNSWDALHLTQAGNPLALQFQGQDKVTVVCCIVDVHITKEIITHVSYYVCIELRTHTNLTFLNVQFCHWIFQESYTIPAFHAFPIQKKLHTKIHRTIMYVLPPTALTRLCVAIHSLSAVSAGYRSKPACLVYSRPRELPRPSTWNIFINIIISLTPISEKIKFKNVSEK